MIPKYVEQQGATVNPAVVNVALARLVQLQKTEEHEGYDVNLASQKAAAYSQQPGPAILGVAETNVAVNNLLEKFLEDVSTYFGAGKIGGDFETERAERMKYKFFTRRSNQDEQK